MIKEIVNYREDIENERLYYMLKMWNCKTRA